MKPHKITIPLIVFTLGMFISTAAAAEPEFPKIGVEYEIRLPQTEGQTHWPARVIFKKWIRGDWYEVVYPRAGSEGVIHTNLNVAHALTMTEAKDKWLTQRIAKENRRKASSEQDAVSKK